MVAYQCPKSLLEVWHRVLTSCSVVDFRITYSHLCAAPLCRTHLLLKATLVTLVFTVQWGKTFLSLKTPIQEAVLRLVTMVLPIDTKLQPAIDISVEQSFHGRPLLSELIARYFIQSKGCSSTLPSRRLVLPTLVEVHL